MNNLEFGLSELYEVFFKATYPIEINGQKFEEDDVIFVSIKYKFLIYQK